MAIDLSAYTPEQIGVLLRLTSVIEAGREVLAAHDTVQLASVTNASNRKGRTQARDAHREAICKLRYWLKEYDETPAGRELQMIDMAMVPDTMKTAATKGG